MNRSETLQWCAEKIVTWPISMNDDLIVPDLNWSWSKCVSGGAVNLCNSRYDDITKDEWLRAKKGAEQMSENNNAEWCEEMAELLDERADLCSCPFEACQLKQEAKNYREMKKNWEWEE